MDQNRFFGVLNGGGKRIRFVGGGGFRFAFQFALANGYRDAGFPVIPVANNIPWFGRTEGGLFERLAIVNFSDSGHNASVTGHGTGDTGAMLRKIRLRERRKGGLIKGRGGEES